MSRPRPTCQCYRLYQCKDTSQRARLSPPPDARFSSADSSILPMTRLHFAILLLAFTSCRGADRGAAADTDRAASSLGLPAHSPDIARRADSLLALRPEDEARRAIARGDLRFLADCGDACMPSGVPLDSAARSRDSLAVGRLDSLHLIKSTSDDVINADAARLNDVASDFATRYNRVIWRERLRRGRMRPPA